MKGFYLTQEGKLVVGVAPIDIGGVAKVSDYWSMANYQKASIVVCCGVITNAAQITVFESQDNAGTGEAAIGFSYYALDGAGDIGARTTVAAAGFSTGTTNNRAWIIELDASELSDGSPYMTVKTDGAAANIITILPILEGARYAQANPPEALT